MNRKTQRQGEVKRQDGPAAPAGAGGDGDVFRQAFLHSAIAMMVLSPEGSVVVANDAAAGMTGRSLDVLAGLSLLDLVHADDRSQVADMLADTARQPFGTRSDGVAVHLDPVGAPAPLPVEVSLVAGDGRITATIRDIESRSALRTIIENMPGAVTLFGPDLSMRACNGKLRELLGFPDSLFENGLPGLETLLRYNAERGEYGPGDVDALVAERIQQARTPQAHVFERRRMDGSTLEVRGAPLPGGGFVTIYTDVTARKKAEEALQASMAESERVRAHLHSVIEHLPQGVTVVDQNLDIVVWNSAFAGMLGIPPEVMPPGQVVAYADAIRFVAARGDYGPGEVEDLVRQRVALASNPTEHRFERVLPSGRIIEVFGQPMGDGGFVTTYTDITDIRASAQKLERTLELMDEIISRSVVLVFELDETGRIAFASGTERVLGFAATEVVGRRLTEFVDPEDLAGVRAILAGKGGQHEQVIAAFNCNGGRKAWLSLSGYGFRGGFRGVAIDITEKHQQDLRIKDLIQRLEQSALHDHLTGLPNRTKFVQRFDDEVARMGRSGKPMAVIVLDLDHFKSINDTFGHLVGDLVLRETAKTLRSAVRQSDLVARFGGEEFVILLPDTDIAGAVTLAENLRAAVEAQVLRVSGRSERINVTATFGVADMELGHVLALDDFLDRADQAAYRGKNEGRNRVCAATR
jgi:diguanylate cyclase (GGDEF)-like protein/PAS domain S-box-containing protein